MQKQASRQHVVNNQTSHASVVSQHSPAAKTNTDIYFYHRTANQICSKCGYPNRPTTGLLPKCKARNTGSEI